MTTTESKGKKMTKSEIIIKIKQLNTVLHNDGFIIDGLFGSYARGDYNEQSDIDILYHLEKVFFDKYRGFIGFKKLDEIKQTISKELNKKIDLAPMDNLSQTAKKYILKDVIYV